METTEKLNPFIRIRGIKGRGKEVLAELERRGGKNTLNLSGDNENGWYLISSAGEIFWHGTSEDLGFFLANYEEATLPKWRAEAGRNYYFITSYLRIEIEIDNYMPTDGLRYRLGNYFQTREEAELYANKFKEMLKERQ